MANMSYCMFENTGNDLAQCVRAMLEADSIEDLDLSPYEQTAFERMKMLCQEFLEIARHFEKKEAA